LPAPSRAAARRLAMLDTRGAPWALLRRWSATNYRAWVPAQVAWPCAGRGRGAYVSGSLVDTSPCASTPESKRRVLAFIRSLFTRSPILPRMI